jgi:two-component sensor histidine kinase
MPKTIRVYFIPALHSIPRFASDQTISWMHSGLTVDHYKMKKNTGIIEKICSFLKLHKLKDALINEINHRKKN